MHTRVMFLLKKEQSSDVRECVSIAKTLHSMGPASINGKFDAFIWPRSQLDQEYKNNQVCAIFVEHIALEQRQALAYALLHTKYSSR